MSKDMIAERIQKDLACQNVTEEDLLTASKKHSEAQMNHMEPVMLDAQKDVRLPEDPKKKQDTCEKNTADRPKNLFYYAKKAVCLDRPRRTDPSMGRRNEQKEQAAEQKEIDEQKIAELTNKVEKLERELATQQELTKKTEERLKESATQQELINQIENLHKELATQKKQLESLVAEMSGGIENRLLTLQNDFKFLNYSTGAKRHLMYFVFNRHDLEKGNQYSKRFTFGDAWCNLYAYKNGNNLVMIMRANNLSSMPFKRSLTVRLLGTKGDVCHMQNEVSHGSSFNIVPWDCFIGAENGFLDSHGNGVAEVDFTGFNLTGLKCAGIAPEFKPNALLSIQNRFIFVNKELLASCSSFFKELFDSKKHGGKEFQDIRMAKFIFFLDVIYGAQDLDGYKCITEFKLEGILQLARRFSAPEVIKRCEQFMKQNFSMEKSLLLAFKYNLNDMLAECLNYYKPKENLIKLISTEEYDSLSDDARKLLKEKLKDTFMLFTAE